MRVFFSVGEPSGDQHAAHLIHEMRKRRPELEAVGYGGPAMQAAGCELRFQLTKLAVMGFLRVVPLLRQFIGLAKRAAEEFKENPPDAVVLVDFPGFNWYIAKAAKKAGVPVYYYMPPQLWAWGPWRVRKVRRLINQVLCALPFEHDWYTKRGVNATYVGHPFFDEVAEKKLDADFIDGLSGKTPLVAVLPGSRTHEVERNLPLMAKVISRLQKKHPDTRFVVASYNEQQQTLANGILSDAGVTLPSYIDRTSEVIEAADCCLMVSGSVSLELLARKTPGAVVYRLTRLHTTLRPVVIGCKYITLTNLIAGRELMPEFVSAGSEEPTVESLFGVLDGWLGEPGQLAAVTQELTELAESAVLPGATGNAADAILSKVPKRERLAA